MKLREYARLMGICYRTAYYQYKCGEIKGAFQTASRTIIVPDDFEYVQKVIRVDFELAEEVKGTLTHELLIRLLDYNELTGEFYWKVTISPANIVGRRAGAACKNHYSTIQIGGVRWQAHKLAWWYVTGNYPKEEIDHIDNNIHNNSFANLREATRSENMYNTRKSLNNTSGVKGVSWYPRYKKWRARITVNKKVILIGYFETLEEATYHIQHYRKQLHKEFARHE